MNKKSIVASVVLLMLSGAATQAQVRTEEAPEPQVREVSPEMSFDAAAAASALAAGSATIKGKACALVEKRVFAAADRTVILFPDSPYINEYIRLRDKNRLRDGVKDPGVHVGLPENVYKYRIEAKTDSDGNFRITRLRPGRYYLTMIFNFTQVRQELMWDASGQWYGDDEVGRSRVLETFVDVPQDGDVVKATVSSGRIGWSKSCGKIE